MSSHHRLTAYFVFEKIPNPTNKMKRDHSEKVYRAKKKSFSHPSQVNFMYAHKSHWDFPTNTETRNLFVSGKIEKMTHRLWGWVGKIIQMDFLWVGNFLLLLPICLLNVRWRKIETFWCFYKFFPQFGRVQKGMKKCWAWKEIFKFNFCIKIEWIIKWMWKQV